MALSPEEIDALDTTPTTQAQAATTPAPGRSMARAYTPQEIDALPEVQISHQAPGVSTIAGGPENRAAFNGDVLETVGDVAKGVPRAIGKGFGVVGNLAKAVVADTAAGMRGSPEFSGNIPAFFTGDEMPIDKATQDAYDEAKLRNEFPVAGMAATASTGMAKTLPKIAALPVVGPGLLAQSVAAGGLFGLDDEGNFHPKDAIIGALLPGVGKLGRVGASALLGRAVAAGSETAAVPIVQKIAEAMGEQASLDAYMTATRSPELVAQYKTDPMKFKESLAEIIGTNLAFGLLGAERLKRDVPSDTQLWIQKTAESMAGKAVQQRIVSEYPPDVLRDIYNRVNASDPSATPEERNLVTYLNSELGKPAEAIKRGARVVDETKDLPGQQFWRDYLGLPKTERSVELMGEGEQPTQTRSKRAGSRRLLSPAEIDSLPAQPGDSNAPNPINEQTGVQSERVGVNEVRQTGPEAGAGNRLPSPAGKPEETPAVTAPTKGREAVSPVGTLVWTDLGRPKINDVRIQKPDGSIVTSDFIGYQDFRAVGGGMRPMVGYEGSHGGLKAGDTILTRIPSPEEWNAIVEKGKPQAPSTSVKPTVPEPRETLDAQADMLKRGVRNVVMVTPGEQMPTVPKGHKVLETDSGKFIYNPKTVTPERITTAIRENKLGDLLDYGIPAKPEKGTEVGAVVVRSPKGVEKQGVLTDEEHLPAVIDKAKDVAQPGDTISVEPEAKVIADRNKRGASVRSDNPSTSLTQLRKELKLLKQGLPVAEDMAANDKGASLNKLQAQITAVEKQISDLVGTQPVPEKWKRIGVNAQGHQVYEDDIGVRSYVEGGVRVTEAVSMVPTRTESGAIVIRPTARTTHTDEYRTVDEIAGKPKVASDANAVTESERRGSGSGRTEPAATGGVGAGEQAATPAEGPAERLQPGIRAADGGSGSEAGAGNSRIADADANGVPAKREPETPVIPAAPTGVETSPEFRGESTEANPAPDVEFGAESRPLNIRLSENPAPTALVARVKANIEAIALIKKLEADDRFPTEEERQKLAQWSGWGSFKELFNQGRAEKRDWDTSWMKRYGSAYDKLVKLLTPDEFNAAAESSVNAHYTSQEVVSAMWQLVKRLGYQSGKALEPSAGSGVFIGYMPEDLAHKTRWTGIEMEPMTGKIFSYLYPEANVRITPFEKAKLPNAFYDLVITNVPFHEVGPGGEYPSLNLHNYFIARALDKTKAGGLVVVISTANTMESQAAQRAFLADKGQLVGAIRLPNNAFKESASTEVVTDILVLRKPDGKPFDGAQPWTNTVQVDTEQGPTRINEYFALHPDMVLGKNALTGTMYRKDSYTVEATSGALADKLAAAINKFPENIVGSTEPVGQQHEAQQTQLEEGTLVLDDNGHVLEARNFQLEIPSSWDSGSASLVKRARLYVGLRDTLKRQYTLEGQPDATDAEIEANRANLLRAYHALKKDVGGPLNSNERKVGYLSTDPDYYTVLGLEVFKEAKDPKNTESTITVVEPAAVLSQRVKQPDVAPSTAANATDALGVSMAYRGGFDMDYVKQLTGMSEEAIETELIANDLAYKNPETGRVEATIDYLAGDVREKLAKAIFAAKESDEFVRNVEALKQVIPETIPFGRIKIGLTSRWTPVSVFNAFAKEVIGLKGDEISFVPGVEEFSVKTVRYASGLSDVARVNWSTNDMSAPELLAYAMNFKRAKIMRRTSDDKYVEDTNASALANQVLDKMSTEFQNWVRTTEARVGYQYFDAENGAYAQAQLPVWDVLEREFNRTKNSFVDPKHDGSQLKLPGLSTQVMRKEHMLNGVMRAIVQGSSVYGHGVGSGKTFLSIVAMHELQRIGLMKKGAVVIKKPTVDQFRMSIERAYPGSRVLMPTQKDFQKENRKKLTARIASGKWDFIILTHEQFKAIRTSEESVNSFFNDQIEQLRTILRSMGEESAEDAKSTRGMDSAVRNIVKKIKSLKKRLGAHTESIAKKQDVGIQWEDLGIDGVWIDESHNFKKMPIPTQMDNVKGIPTDFSQRAVDLLIKIRDVQRRTNGRNVFFASGTPVSNTLAELWVMFHATNPKLLKDFGIETFDSFATTYADVISNFELGWDNKFKDVTRMARFKNPGSLTLLTRLGMDVRMGNKELGLDVPELEGGKPIVRVIKTTNAFSRWLSFLDNIVGQWESLDPKGRFENSWVPITAMRAGSAAALDPRSAFVDGEDDSNSKVNTAVRDILVEWEKGKERRTTMMVFADMYRTLDTSKLQGFVGGSEAAPKTDEVEVPDADREGDDTGDTGAQDANAFEKNAVGSFNLYHDVRSKLVAAGVPEHEIAVITEHDSDAKRAALFNKVRSGAVRILLGSTEKIGEGVDVPQRMSAQFHLDPPMQMTPAKMEQRFGRIIRQGNLHSPKNWNLPVRVYLYAQERSMDAAIYQMLENKSIMVLQALKGQFLGDEFDDPAGEFTTAMAEMKAAATGDTRVLELAKLQKEVRELNLEEGAYHRRIAELRGQIGSAEDIAANQKRQAEKYAVIAEAMRKELADKDTIILTHKAKRYVGQKAIDEFLERARPAFEASIKEPGTKAVIHMKLGTGVNVKLDGQTVRSVTGEVRSIYDAFFYVGDEWTIGVPQWPSKLNTVESLLTAAAGVPRYAHDASMRSMATAQEQERLAKVYGDTFKATKFDKKPELDAKRARLWQLENELRNEGKKKTVEDVPPGHEQEVDVAPPIEDRIRQQMADLLPQLEKTEQDVTRAEGRVNLTQAGTQEHESAKSDLQAANDAWASSDGRMRDLERRLATVLKANNPDANVSMPSTTAKPQLSIEPTPTSPGEERVVQGLKELATLLRDPRSGLSPEARSVALALLNTPAMQNLDWSKLTVAIKNRIEGGYAGSADVVANLIEIAKSSSPRTIPHEVFHFLFDMLAPEDKGHVEDARLEAVRQALDGIKDSGLSPDVEKLFGQLASGKLSSEQFATILARLQVENPDAAQWWATKYDLINPSEFLASLAGRRFAEDTFSSQNYTWLKSFLVKLGQWIRSIVDSVKRVIGLKPGIDQVYREMLAGKRLTTPDTGAQYEGVRHGSIENEPTASMGVDPAELEMDIEHANDSAEKEGWMKTEVLGRKDNVRGRDVLTDAERAAGASYAKQVFDRTGLQVTKQDNGLWRLTDPDFESEIEGRKLLTELTKEIAVQNQPGTVTGYLGNLLNSVVVNMTQDAVTAFSPELKRELYSVAQGERSQRGLLLGALAGVGKTVDYVARNVDVVLSKVYADRFGGDDIRRIMARVMTEFRSMFTDDEIRDILKNNPGLEDSIDKIVAMNRRDEGGRVYRRAQGLLKPKNLKKVSRLESDVRVAEAVNQILQQLKSQGIEPKPSPNKPVPPLQRLLLLVQPENSEKIDKAIANAVADAERNAGIKAAIKNTKDADERQDLLARFSAGEEPDEDMVEAGLNTPEFSHWKALRDELLAYSPTTLKVVRNLVRNDFRGVRYGNKPQITKPADTKIDLSVLAKQPDDEVRRVLNAYAKNLDEAMGMAGATDETRLRVLDNVQNTVSEQLDRIRKAIRDKALATPVKRGEPLTPEQRIAQLINAGIFADDRLDIPQMVDRLAGKTALKNLTPNVRKLVGEVFNTPFYRQDELATRFGQQMADRLAITSEQQAAASSAFTAAFAKRFEQARKSAFNQSVASLSPVERKSLKKEKGTWKKVEDAVNSGIFDTSIVLQSLAHANGWNIPTAKDVERMKGWAADLQRLGELSPAEVTAIGNSPKAVEAALSDKRGATLEKRIAIKKKIEAQWSKMTHPLRWSTAEGRTNIAMAINEFTSANLLFKIGFPTRLAYDIFVQGLVHTPTRAIGAAITRYQDDISAGRTASVWGEINSALRAAYRVRLASFKANTVNMRQSLAGKGDARNVDRLMSRIAVFERMEAKAEDLAAQGKTAQAAALRLLHMVSFSYRMAQTLDNFQGLPAEYQEMRQQVETALRENGMSKAEAAMNADNVLGDMQAEWSLALARVQEIFNANNVEATENDLKSAAWHVVKSRQYARMKGLGLPADDFEEINRILRSTVAWAEREDGGLGGYVGAMMRKSTEVLAKMGLPMPLARFANAIATGINRKLMFTPLGYFPDAFKGSPWMRTPEDRLQRKIEASIGTAFGLIAIALVFSGLVRVWLKPPTNKAERDLWEKEGHRANTIEFVMPDGSFIPHSLIIGPVALVSPYFAAAGAVKDAQDRHEKAQQKLNAEAAAQGVAPGNVKPLTMADYLAIAGEVAWNSVLGGRTASGLVSSFSDQGLPNANKFISSTLSPLVPGLPGMQEVSRMAGVALDPRLATVFDFMVPLPTSAAAKVNVLGDNVGTEDAVQRIVQILTGGTYPLPVNPNTAHDAAGYQALFDSGYRPPAISQDKGYSIDGEMRPMTKAELQKYTVLRGQYLKEELLTVDPTDKKAVAAAFKDANTRALSAVGVDTEAQSPSQGSGQAAGTSRGSRFSSVASNPPGMAQRARVGSRRVGGSGRRVRGAGVSRVARGPSLRPRAGLKLARAGSVRRGPSVTSRRVTGARRRSA